MNRNDFSKPFFQDPPEELDESWRHGALIGGFLNAEEKIQNWMIADGYRLAGDALVEDALRGRTEADETVWPILFLYRHALELYLKVIVRPAKLDHKIEPLFAEFEEIVLPRYPKGIPKEIIDRALELSGMDPNSFAFRYATSKNGEDSIPGGEYWVDLPYIRDYMSVLAEAFRKMREVADE